MMSLLGLIRQALRCTSGTAALEGAIVMPVAIVLMAGGVEFGQLFSAYGTAAKSMRDAARYLARVPNQDNTAICGWGLTNAKNLAVYGKIDPSQSDPPLFPGWSVSDVTLESPSCTGTVTLTDPIIIDLKASFHYSGTMFSVIGLSNNPWPLHVEHQERSIGE